jgi:hypothetical protein
MQKRLLLWHVDDRDELSIKYADTAGNDEAIRSDERVRMLLPLLYDTLSPKMLTYLY